MILSRHWVPGIGDPTFLGWLTVAAYFLATALSVACALRTRRFPRELRAPHQPIWWTFAILLVFLGFNKQLDLQSWLIEVVREMAKRQGWYQDRRVAQAVFVAVVAALACGLLLLVARRLRRVWRGYRLALIGAASLATFVAIRAASFHPVDEVLTALNWILELGGISCVVVAATRFLRRSAAGPPAGA